MNLADIDGREPHGYNMCDGLGEDGYSYGHDEYHSEVDPQWNVTPAKKKTLGGPPPVTKNPLLGGGPVRRAYLNRLAEYLLSLSWSPWPTRADEGDLLLDQEGTVCEAVEVLGLVIGSAGMVLECAGLVVVGEALTGPAEVCETALDRGRS